MRTSVSRLKDGIYLVLSGSDVDYNWGELGSVVIEAVPDSDALALIKGLVDSCPVSEDTIRAYDHLYALLGASIEDWLRQRDSDEHLEAELALIKREETGE